jgi:Uma2 family endonuclease
MSIATSKRIRFTVKEYFRMSEAGVFDGRRVELLDGRIYKVLAQSNPHRSAVAKINIILTRHFGDVSRYWLSCQSTCILEKYDAPDPDLYVLNAPVGTPDEKLPVPFLLIEVSYTTYKRDSGIKLRRYAAAGVKDYWIVNIRQQRVEVYRDPENPTGRKRDWRYATPMYFGVNDAVALLAYPQIKLNVRDMLP